MNEPLKFENKEILYRPGGHGALIENLKDLEEEIIFIKNIDNVSHRSQSKDTIESKKMLAPIGMEVKQQIDRHMIDLLADDFDLTKIKELIMKNTGEPGGGSFVVDNGNYLDLQICETSEIDMSDSKQVEIFKASEYFNPVDLVCV